MNWAFSSHTYAIQLDKEAAFMHVYFADLVHCLSTKTAATYPTIRTLESTL